VRVGHRSDGGETSELVGFNNAEADACIGFDFLS
jgi:hypothetical protein